jgi:hypothetical protein
MFHCAPPPLVFQVPFLFSQGKMQHGRTESVRPRLTDRLAAKDKTLLRVLDGNSAPPPTSRLQPISRCRQLYGLAAPYISAWDEEGFSSCIVHPCRRAVATTPHPTDEDLSAGAPTRQCVPPHQSDCNEPCCLRPSPEGSATGVRHFEATSAFTSVTARRLAPHPYDGFVDGLPEFSYLPPGHPSYGASDLCPGGLYPTEYTCLP